MACCRYGRYAIIEPILLWHAWMGEAAQRASLGGRHLAYVWVLEQDVNDRAAHAAQIPVRPVLTVHH